ncbi:MAG: hypothetical protein EOO04_20990 [Chitinophagaceae bacterium]|nr:MAG: hypothetical protein EOO04_20990 [Chitinophagaceae bacterium]
MMQVNTVLKWGIVSLIALFTFGCNGRNDSDKVKELEKQVKELAEENQVLKDELADRDKSNLIEPEIPISKPTLAYVLIEYSDQQFVPEEIIYPRYDAPLGAPQIPVPPLRIPSHYKAIPKKWFSKIQSFNIFDENTKFYMMDKNEDDFALLHNRSSITARECFVFDSYAEASVDLARRRSTNK